MGGNALTQVNTHRISREEYRQIVGEIDVLLNGILHWDVPAYRTKETFGDIDVVCIIPDIDFKQFIEFKFHPTQIVKNGNVYSFDYKNVQIDFIYFNTHETGTAIFAVNYFSWNDLGNFIGRVARRCGMKFGHDGLWFCLREVDNEDRMIKEVLITDVFDEALHILGYDVDRYHRGFDTKDDIFDYVTTSKFFDPTGFVLANRNYTSRTRDKKRQMYTDFLQYIRDRYGIDEDTSLSVNYDIHKGYVYDVISSKPEVQEEIDRCLAEVRINAEYKSRVNGVWCSETFGLSGKELGAKMKDIREYIETNNLKTWFSNEDFEFSRKFVKLLSECEKV